MIKPHSAEAGTTALLDGETSAIARHTPQHDGHKPYLSRAADAAVYVCSNSKPLTRGEEEQQLHRGSRNLVSSQANVSSPSSSCELE